MSRSNDESETEYTDKKRSLTVITQQTSSYDRNPVKLEDGLNFIRRNSLLKIHRHSIHKSEPAYPPTSKWRKLYHICRPWRWELLSCISALFFFIAISAILCAYNNRLLATWPYGLTINTIISVLATFMKVALMIPVAEGISQLKWIWFRSERSLHDFEKFDLASRGPWGALLLFFKLRKTPLISLGAFITVLALISDPSTQQVVQHITKSTHLIGATASLARCTFYNQTTEFEDISHSLKSAIYNGLLGSRQQNKILGSCPTGNCTFDEPRTGYYSSLGMCSNCRDITSLITPINIAQDQAYKLPDGSTVGADSTDPRQFTWMVMTGIATDGDNRISNGMDQVNNVESFSAKLNMIAMTGPNCTFWYGDGDPPWGCKYSELIPFATTCALYPCVQTFSSSISDGILSEELISEEHNERSHLILDHEEYLTFIPTTCVIDGHLYNASFYRTTANMTGDNSYVQVNEKSDTIDTNRVAWYLEDCVYAIDTGSVTAFSDFFRAAFNHSLSGPLSKSGYKDLALIQTSTLAMGDWAEIMFAFGNASLPKIEEVFKNIAAAMTQDMKATGSGNSAIGTVMMDQVYIKANFPWLVPPGLLVLLSTAFLACTIWTSQGRRVWKSSSLAVLFNGVHGRRDFDTLIEMEKSAKSVRARLVNEEAHVSKV